MIRDGSMLGKQESLVGHQDTSSYIWHTIQSIAHGSKKSVRAESDRKDKNEVVEIIGILSQEQQTSLVL